MLSEEFLGEYAEIPWKMIMRMRDIVAHHYGSLDYGIVWNMSVSDIPEFYMCSEYQNKIIGGKKMGKEISDAVKWFRLASYMVLVVMPFFLSSKY